MPWTDINPKDRLLEKVKSKGGWVNAHAHIDRSYIINDENWHLTAEKLENKWDYIDEFKKTATVKDIVEHMSRVLDNQIAQGVQAIGSFIDCDSVVKDKCLKAADKVRQTYKSQIQIKYISQPIKGLMDPTERKWFEESASFVDIIGGLPERDSLLRLAEDHRADHLDILFENGKKHNKPLHIHIDQLNDPAQRDTELLINKTKEHGFQGKVTAIHGISIAAQPKDYREKIYQGLKEQSISFVVCPTGWIDSRRNETMTPTHSAITPVDEMVKFGVNVAIGTDNIADIYKPFVDGDMWTELRFLLETAHMYDIDSMELLSDIATVNGLRALWL